MEQERKRSARGMRSIDLVYVALGAALLAVCSWVTIPGPVPFTLQTFAVFCVLLVFGGARGTAAIAVWLLLGGIGAPVFSSFGGGPGALFGATGGYLLGFLATAALFWAVTAVCKKQWAAIAALAVGLVACYAFGTAWFRFVYAPRGGIGLAAALGLCVYPFILPDCAKLALAAAVARIPALRSISRIDRGRGGHKALAFSRGVRYTESMKELLENTGGGKAVCPTRAAFAVRDGKLVVDFVAEQSDLTSAYTGRNTPLFEGNVVEVFVGSRSHYLEVEVAPNGSLFTAWIDNDGTGFEATFMTEGVAAAVHTRANAYDTHIEIALSLFDVGADALLANAFRIEMRDGAAGPQTLFALNPTLCGTFHRPEAFVPLLSLLDRA